ncbi:MAG TPA: TetR family transcriptional regulator [Acidimicrobiales bacterium]|nr:TetR family transcriptional regulator [Acidimicrobiales bacterium]
MEDEGVPLDPAAMTPRQRERRERLLTAVHELIEEGRVRDLQVKEIADRAGVSLAAVYRYFSSKEHLLAEALLDWAQQFSTQRRGRDFAATVRRGVDAYRRHPHYAELFLEVAASRDPYALETFGRMSDGVTAALLDAVGTEDPAVALQIVTIVGNAWLGGLFSCVHGRSDFAGLERSLDAACRLLLAGAGLPA